MSQKKIFVLDTNVILHDSSSIYQFGRHDVVIPMTVLEELDNFKKGNQDIHYNAREFTRTLDKLDSTELFNGGAKIGSGNGRISLRLEDEQHDECKQFKIAVKNDHQILNIACHLVDERPEDEVIFVSKDVNCRMKARAIGLVAQDYTTDHVNVDAYTGYRLVENVNSEVIDSLYDQGAVAVSEIDCQDVYPNEFMILKNGKQSALVAYNHSDKSLQLLKKRSAYGISPRNSEQSFATYALQDRDVQLVTVSGKAGTGKTLLALASALEVEGSYQQILLARPIVALSNSDIGYLPGEISAKIGPYMQPLFDNLSVISSSSGENRAERIDAMRKDSKLLIEPLAYIRGRTLPRTFLIVDEAQNLTPLEVKTIITRAGEGTKIIFTGDIHQIDHPYLNIHSNGLSHVMSKMRGQNIYAHITLTKGERSSLAELASNLL